MAVNTTPIYTKSPQIEWTKLLKTANTALDWTGTVGIIFTAWPDGGLVNMVRAKHAGTNSWACILRLFLNNGGATTTASNNVFITEKEIAAYTLSQTNASPTFDFPDVIWEDTISTKSDTMLFPLQIPANHRLIASVSVALTTGLDVTAFGGTYTA